jgi:homogentisate solanesyltransferase
LCDPSIPLTCDYCDVQKVKDLSDVLLQVLSTASIRKHPRSISWIKVNELKNDLITALKFKSKPKGIVISESNMHHFANESSTTWSLASAAFISSDQQLLNSANRIIEIDDTYFRTDERNALARLIIRYHDYDYEFHCPTPNCGDNCLFLPQRCPNNECHVIVAKRWLDRHDEVCPFKIISCTRECGDSFVRYQLENHLNTVCPLRPVRCHFHEVGCDVGTFIF